MIGRRCNRLTRPAGPAISCIATAVLMAAYGGSDDDASVVAPPNNGMAADAPAAFQPPTANLTQMQLHLNNATANAGTVPDQNTLFGTIRYQWCHGVENAGAPAELQDRAVVPITKIFDDVYYDGLGWVGQYIFRTNQGQRLFLIDTLNNTNEVQTITEPGLRSVGLDPATILAAMPTHGHGDHHGGAGYLQQTYRIPIYLGSADAGAGTNPGANRLPFLVTPLSSEVLTPQPLAFGDLQTILLSTPGHTPGTYSGVVPVRHNGVAYKLAFWGGTAFSNTPAESRQYLDSAERMYRLARDQGVDGTFHTHPFVDGSLRHIDQIRAGGLGAQNPFLIGKDNALRSLTVLRNCSAAKAAQVDASATFAEWRFSTVQAAATWIKGMANNLSASARVKSPYGVVTTGSAEFTFAPGGEKCTAAVNASGIATCTVSSAGATQHSVTASYAGSETATVVHLPASTSAGVRALN